MAAPPHARPRPGAASTKRNGHTRGVIFDFDGTLVDSYPLIETAFGEVMRAHRLDEAARELFRKSRGLPLPEQMKRISPEIWEELVATYRRVDARLGHAQVFRGVPTLVRRLQAAGVRLGVVSSKRHLLVEAELDATRLRPFFEVVIGYEDVTPPKPAPDPLLAAMARLSLERTETLYVGDSAVDLETGRAARVRTVLATWGLPAESRALLDYHRLQATRPSDMLALALPTQQHLNGHWRLA